MILQIPLKPLSVNQAWQGRRFKTKLYKQYQLSLTTLCGVCKDTINGNVQITYKFYLKNYKMTDGDNCVKCLQDCLVQLGYIEDDRKVIKYIIQKYPSRTDRIEVIIESVL